MRPARAKQTKREPYRRARALDCPTPTKIGFLRRGDAKLALRAAEHEIARAGAQGALAVYKCGCGLFHLGHRVTKHREDARDIQAHRVEESRRA